MSRNGARPTAILWDLDGTLADTHPIIHRCVDETFREFFAQPYERELWERSVGHPLTTVMEQGFDKYGIPCIDTAPLIQFYRERLKSYEALVRPFPGSCETVRRLSQGGVRQAIVTTKFGEAAARHLSTIGLDGIFEVVTTGDICVRYKPDPEPFCRTLDSLRLAADACIMVGDSAADVLGSRNAGVRSVAALWGTLDHDAVHAAGPDYIANRPEDVLSIMEEWQA